MYCDYEALDNYKSNMVEKFHDMMALMDSVDSSFKSVTGTGSWDSPTRDYFANMYSAFQENYEVLISKYKNIEEYLENVAINYRRMDS